MASCAVAALVRQRAPQRDSCGRRGASWPIRSWSSTRVRRASSSSSSRSSGDRASSALAGPDRGHRHGAASRRQATGGETAGRRDLRQREIRDMPAALALLVAWLRALLGGAAPSAVGHRVVHGGPTSRPVRSTTRCSASSSARAAGAAAPAAQPGGDRGRPRKPARAAPGRLLRHRLSSRAPESCATVRPADELRGGRAPLRLSRPVLRIRRRRACARSRPRSPTAASSSPTSAAAPAMCAMNGGRSVDTTMGFTALDGLPWGRAGRARPRRGALPACRRA